MNRETIATIDITMNKLKAQGYGSFFILYNRRPEAEGQRLEILCSETTNPKLLAAMAMDALKELAHPVERNVVVGPVN